MMGGLAPPADCSLGAFGQQEERIQVPKAAGRARATRHAIEIGAVDTQPMQVFDPLVRAGCRS